MLPIYLLELVFDYCAFNTKLKCLTINSIWFNEIIRSNKLKNTVIDNLYYRCVDERVLFLWDLRYKIPIQEIKIIIVPCHDEISLFFIHPYELCIYKCYISKYTEIIYDIPKEKSINIMYNKKEIQLFINKYIIRGNDHYIEDFYESGEILYITNNIIKCYTKFYLPRQYCV